MNPVTKTREEKIHELFLNEISEKSLVAGIVFSFFAVVIFTYGLGLSELLIPMRIACVGVIVAAFFRFLVSRSNRANLNRFWLLTRLSVALNAISWSIIFSLTAWEHKEIGIHFVIAVALMTNFLTGSVITLSYDKWLFFPFQFIMIVPMLTISIIKAGYNSHFYIFASLFVFEFLYHTALYVEYRRQLRRRFSDQLDLETSFETLQTHTEQLVHTSKLAAVGEMAGGMAHEINNPLAIIMMKVLHLQRVFGPGHPDSAQVDPIINEIELTVRRISRIIQGLRNVSRSSEDGEHRSIVLSELLEDVTGVCSERLNSQKIEFSISDKQQMLSKKLLCERVQISQLLLNLFSNASDAIPEDSSDKWLSVSFFLDQKYFSIEVANSGPLIPDEVKSRLFQPFFTTKEVGKGTGLGLPISKKLMEAHDGTIELKPGAPHTTFVLKFPASRIS